MLLNLLIALILSSSPHIRHHGMTLILQFYEPTVELEDLDRFLGDTYYTEQCRSVALRATERLIAQKQFYPGYEEWFGFYQVDAQKRATAWEWLYYAMSNRDHHIHPYVLSSLEQLRRVIGYEAYYSGTMPSPTNISVPSTILYP